MLPSAFDPFMRTLAVMQPIDSSAPMPTLFPLAPMPYFPPSAPMPTLFPLTLIPNFAPSAPLPIFAPSAPIPTFVPSAPIPTFVPSAPMAPFVPRHAPIRHEPGTSVYVRGLADYVGHAKLREEFQRYGRVVEAKVIFVLKITVLKNNLILVL